MGRLAMNQYLVDYRESKIEDTGCSSRTVHAHRVEAWSNDYAFFGHPKAPGALTLLVPRELVWQVRMSHMADDGGDSIDAVSASGSVNWSLPGPQRCSATRRGVEVVKAAMADEEEVRDGV